MKGRIDPLCAKYDSLPAKPWTPRRPPPSAVYLPMRMPTVGMSLCTSWDAWMYGACSAYVGRLLLASGVAAE